MLERKLIPFFDTPYLGFATGNFERDSYVVKAWAKTGKPCFTT
jgi:aspartate/tyrosine/aromatic aminotransferase